MTYKVCTREDDERVLRALWLRCRGVSAGRVGRHMGYTDAAIRVMTDKVLKADVAESGEPEAEVRAAYWRGHGK